MQATESAHRWNNKAALYTRVLRVGSTRPGTTPRDERGRVAGPSDARRRRILQEARSAVLDRIRHPR